MATASSPANLTYVRPWLYPKQERAIFAPERYAIIEASTKTGKTVGCMVWLAEMGMRGRAGHNYWWVAPIYAQAKIAFRRLKRALPRHVYQANESELTLTLANGAVLWFKGAENPDSLYGEDVYGAVIDESTRVKDASFHAVRSTLTATRGPLRIIGNVKGRKNWAYQLARRAEAGDQDMHYAKLTAYDAVEAGVLALEEVEDAKRVLPANVFNELYLAEPSDDGGNPFGLDAIDACIRDLSFQPVAVMGWDLAKSTDWTVGIGLDATGAVCGVERWNKHQLPAGMVGSYWEATVARIRQVTGGMPALVDSTGLGDPVFEAIGNGASNFAPFVFTSTSKQQLMEGLAVAIQQRRIAIPEGVIAQELRDFEYVYTRTGVKYSAPEGLHDDAVMALGLAWRLMTIPPAIDETVMLDDDDRVTIGPRY